MKGRELVEEGGNWPMKKPAKLKKPMKKPEPAKLELPAKLKKALVSTCCTTNAGSPAILHCCKLQHTTLEESKEECEHKMAPIKDSGLYGNYTSVMCTFCSTQGPGMCVQCLQGTGPD